MLCKHTPGYFFLLVMNSLKISNCGFHINEILLFSGFVFGMQCCTWSAKLSLVRRGQGWCCLPCPPVHVQSAERCFLVMASDVSVFHSRPASICNLHLLIFGESLTIIFNNSKEFCLMLALDRDYMQWITSCSGNSNLSETNHASSGEFRGSHHIRLLDLSINWTLT